MRVCIVWRMTTNERGGGESSGPSLDLGGGQGRHVTTNAPQRGGDNTTDHIQEPGGDDSKRSKTAHQRDPRHRYPRGTRGIYGRRLNLAGFKMSVLSFGYEG